MALTKLALHRHIIYLVKRLALLDFHQIFSVDMVKPTNRNDYLNLPVSANPADCAVNISRVCRSNGGLRYGGG